MNFHFFRALYIFVCVPNIQDLEYDQDFDFEKNTVFCRPMIIDKLVFLVLIIVLDMITIALWHKG